MGNTISPVKSPQKKSKFQAPLTENISSTIPYMNKLTANAKILKTYLDVQDLDSSDSEIDIKLSDTENTNNYFNKNNTLHTSNLNLSDTSPFISSDIYNNLVNNNQTGGSKKSKKSMKMDSSDSTTTSSSSEKKVSSESNTEELDSINVNSDISLESYESSSAHTGGSVISSSVNESTLSNSFNDFNKSSSDSINTSDINMISVEN